MKSKLLIIPFIFLFCLMFASATLYVATDNLIYKATDDVTFSLVFNLSNYTQSVSGSYGYPLYANQSHIVSLTTTDDATKIIGLVGKNSSSFITYMIVSSDSGVTWSFLPTYNNYSLDVIATSSNDYRSFFSGVSMSKDGQYRYYFGQIVGGTKLYRSSNYGGNYFNFINTSVATSNICLSDDGKYVLYGSSVDTITITKSSDYGVTWSSNLIQTTLGSSNTAQICGISPSGQYQYIISSNAGGIIKNYIYSSDYGVSWLNSSVINSDSQQYTPKPNSFIDDSGNVSFLLYNKFYYGRYNGSLSNNAVGYENYIARTDLSKQFVTSNNNLYLFSDNDIVGTIVTAETFTKNITAIAYSINYTTPVIPVCIDKNTYCSSPFTLGGEVVCAYANQQYCSGGCVNAVCTNTINSTCNVIGSSVCIDSTTIGTCSDSNGDNALDYGQISTCIAGQMCIESFNLATCTNVSGLSGTHNPYAFTFFPDSANDIFATASYTIDNTARTLKVLSNNTAHIQNYYNNGVTYISRICDYVETNLLSVQVPLEINDTQTWIIGSPISSNAIIRFSITPEDLSNGTFNISSVIGTEQFRIYWTRNVSNKQFTLYKANGDILYDDYDISATDTLTSVNVELTFDFVSKYYSSKYTFNRNARLTKIVYPIAFTGVDLYDFTFKQHALNTTLNNITINTIPSPTSWTYTFNNTAFIQPCVYSSSGNFRVRTFGNNYASPDYESYLDYDQNINLLGTGTSVEQASFFSCNNLQTSTKYLIVLITIMVLVITGVAIGFAVGHAGLGFIFGLIVSIFAVLVFIALGCIPAWIIVIILIVAVLGIVAMKFLGNTNSTG